MERILTANMLEAKTRLSALVALVESGQVDEVVLARSGRPAARLVPLAPRRPVRLGLAEGLFLVPESIDTCNDELLSMFQGDPDAPAT